MSSLRNHTAIVAVVALMIVGIHLYPAHSGLSSPELSRISISTDELTRAAGQLPNTHVENYF